MLRAAKPASATVRADHASQTLGRTSVEPVWWSSSRVVARVAMSMPRGCHVGGRGHRCSGVGVLTAVEVLDAPLDSLVIGAGQAGLAASYFLRQRGIDHVVLDANPQPGGAWQHRWASLSMDDVHGVADLPASTAPGGSGRAANAVVPGYFGDYEREQGLPVVRPVRVDRVESDGDLLVVRSGDREWRTRTLVNATGTWTRPFVPFYPGIAHVRGGAGAHRALPGCRALPRQAGPRGRRWRLRGAVPRRARPGGRHALGDAARAGVARRTSTRPPASPR